jgi:hypothetical protein
VPTPSTTITVTAGAPDANSYCSIAESNDYFANRALYTDTWDAADDDTKAKALMHATQLLDANYDWYGYTETPTQALAWPRFNMVRPNQSGSWIEPYAGMVEPSSIPQLLKDATAVFAQDLLAKNRTADNDVETQGIASLEAAGAATLTFSGRGGRKVIPDAVADMLRLWGTPRSQRGIARVSRV